MKRQLSAVSAMLLLGWMSASSAARAQPPRYPYTGEALSPEEARLLERDLSREEWSTLSTARREVDDQERTFLAAFEVLRRTQADHGVARGRADEASRRLALAETQLREVEAQWSAAVGERDRGRATLAAMDRELVGLDRAVELFRTACEGHTPRRGAVGSFGGRSRRSLADRIIEGLRDPAIAHETMTDLLRTREPLWESRCRLAEDLARCERAVQDLEQRVRLLRSDIERARRECAQCERICSDLDGRLSRDQDSFRRCGTSGRDSMNRWNSCLADARRARKDRLDRRGPPAGPGHGHPNSGTGGHTNPGPGSDPRPNGGASFEIVNPAAANDYRDFLDHVGRVDRAQRKRLESCVLLDRAFRGDSGSRTVPAGPIVAWAHQWLRKVKDDERLFEDRGRNARANMARLRQGHWCEYGPGAEAWFYFDAGERKVLVMQFREKEATRFHIVEERR